MSAASSEAIRHLPVLAEKVTGVENLRVDGRFGVSPPYLSLGNAGMRECRGRELPSRSILVVIDRDRDRFSRLQLGQLIGGHACAGGVR